MSLELPNPTIHRQENFNDDLTALVIDRLRLGALQQPNIRRSRVMSPRGTERFTQTSPFAGLSSSCPRQESNLDLPLRRPIQAAAEKAGSIGGYRRFGRLARF